MTVHLIVSNISDHVKNVPFNDAYHLNNAFSYLEPLNTNLYIYQDLVYVFEISNHAVFLLAVKEQL